MIKRLRNAIGTLLLVLAIAATQIPVSDVEAVTSSASDFQLNGDTLVKYTGTDSAVSVPESVRKIGPEAFKDNTSLYAVYLPEGVTEIGSGAFSNCPVLSLVDFPSSLKSIGNFAFTNCKTLSLLEIGPEVTEIGYGVFAGCESLEDITISEDNQYFTCEAGVLYNKSRSRVLQALAGSHFTKYNMPSSVKEIEPYAFWGCDDLRFVELSGSLKTIPGYAFSNCKGLEEIRIPGSVTSIGTKAFADCTNLRRAKIPASVTSIQETAFDGCPKLTIEAEEDSYAEEFDNKRDKSDVAAAEYQDTTDRVNTSSVSGLAGSAADAGIVNESSLVSGNGTSGSAAESVSGNNGSTSGAAGSNSDASGGTSGQGASNGNTSGQGAANDTSGQGASNDGNVSGAGSSDGASSVTGNVSGAGSVSREIGNVSIVGGNAVVFIDNRNQPVYGSTYTGSGVLGSSGAAASIRNGEAIFSEESVSSVYSSGLRDAFPDAAVTGTGNEADGSSDGAGVSANEGSYSSGEDTGKGGGFPKYTVIDGRIAGQAYYQDPEMTSYEFPENITSIGDFAFARTPMTKVVIPESVTSIGYGAFYHCDNLIDVDIPRTVTEIEPYAFDKTAWLENWKNGGSTEDYKIVGDGILIAYKGTDGKLTLPEGIKQIAAGVFKDHKGITDVSLPNTLQIIGEEAFSGCSNLKSVSGGVAVTDIRDRAFAGCPIETVRIPESVEHIGLGAYDQSSCLNAATPNAVVFLGATLPTLSYEKNAQRLSNEKYRNDAFAGIEVAIVGEGMSDFTGTILDENSYGFHGVISSLQTESRGNAAGTLHVIGYTAQEDGAQVNIPESVNVYGKPYGFDNTEDVTIWSASRQPDADSAEQAVVIRAVGLGLSGNVQAVLSGHTERYLLDIRESSEAEHAILPAYRLLYGANADPGMIGYEITLYEQSGQVPITKLGKEPMQITMPVPEGMETGALHVVCIDDDGQLEEAPAQLSERNGQIFVTFEATHFSPYAIYHYENGQGAAIIPRDGSVLTSLTRRKDASPDTGDWIHPKWFLAIGLFALSMMTFFLKGNAKKTPGIQ